jgi:4-amino-4-deoxy-L-arabinose transferase-like glycosyltransferase
MLPSARIVRNGRAGVSPVRRIRPAPRGQSARSLYASVVHPLRPWEALLVAGLCAAAVGVTRSHQRDDSPTFDEPIHLFAGHEYAAEGTYWLNPEHPPLLKLLAGAALARADLRTPSQGAPGPRALPGHFVTCFVTWLYRNGIPADALIARGRRPFPFLLALLVLCVWGSARALSGPGAGLLAGGLIALEPNFVGHAGVIHTDVGAALTMTAAVVLALFAVEKGSVAWWGAAGAALGIALASKFTAVLLVPLFPLLPLLQTVTGRPRPEARRVVRGLLGSVLALGTGLAILWGVYAWCLRNMPAADAAESVRLFLLDRHAPHREVERIAALSRWSPPLGHYAAGLAGVELLSEEGRGTNFFHGETSERAFPLYFPAAFLLKTTPSFLVLTLALLVLGGRKLFRFRVLALLLPAAAVMAAAMLSRFNIGVRHILPVYPLLAIAGAGILAERLPRLFPLAAGALLLCSATSLYLAHPNEISYFNALAGGTEGGKRWLSDSNVDWGQDLKRLAATLRRKGWEETTTIVAYSGLPMNYYSPRAKVLDPAAPIAPGRYAVGATVEAIGPSFASAIEGPAAGRKIAELLALLRSRGRRIGRVGGSITIWELPPGTR